MLVPGLTRHDAVSNDARYMAAVLRGDGHVVTFFALHTRGVDEEVLDPATIHDWIESPRDVIVYHYCVGWDFALDLFRRTRARRVVRYHNITPPVFFSEWSPGYETACTEGRAQLDAFAALGCELYLGDSPFNVEDFTSRGVAAERCAVLPPFHEVEQLRSLAADPRRIPQAAPLLLMVGRISPNKGHLDLVDALSACLIGASPDAHLLVIGKLDPNLASYGDAFHRRIAERGVESRVTVLEDANGAELRAAYEQADALLMLSGHEGFCVPLVEAMAMATPVIALGSSAIPWTLGDAGVLWDSADPYLVASTVARVGQDPLLRDTLRDRGRRRYAATFAPDVLADGLRAVVQRWLA